MRSNTVKKPLTNKTNTKNEAKRLKIITFAIAKLEERYWKKIHFNSE